jgi:hypothetical protein
MEAFKADIILVLYRQMTIITTEIGTFDITDIH